RPSNEDLLLDANPATGTEGGRRRTVAPRAHGRLGVVEPPCRLLIPPPRLRRRPSRRLRRLRCRRRLPAPDSRPRAASAAVRGSPRRAAPNRRCSSAASSPWLVSSPEGSNRHEADAAERARCAPRTGSEPARDDEGRRALL